MDTRLIFLDIDGTFIEPGRMEAPASAVEAVRAGRATVTGKGKCREILLPGKLRARLKAYLKRRNRWPGGQGHGCRSNDIGYGAGPQSDRAAQNGENAAKGRDVPVFLTAGGQPLDRSNLWREMRTLCKAAGVDPHKVFPHNLRHLFAKTFYSTPLERTR